MFEQYNPEAECYAEVTFETSRYDDPAKVYVIVPEGPVAQVWKARVKDKAHDPGDGTYAGRWAFNADEVFSHFPCVSVWQRPQAVSATPDEPLFHVPHSLTDIQQRINKAPGSNS